MTVKELREFRKQMVLIENLREENNYYRTKNEQLGHSYARDEALERNLKILDSYTTVYEQSEELKRLIDTVPTVYNRERSLFIDYYFHGKGLYELADKYHYSERNIYYLLKRARDKIGIASE